MNQLCKTCGESDPSQFYKQKWICKGCWNRMTYDRGRNKLDQLLDERGAKCEICGYDKCRSALQWHHRDPDVKEFSISGNRGSNIDKLRSEIEKCDLLCANCHAEVHSVLLPNPTARQRGIGGPTRN